MTPRGRKSAADLLTELDHSDEYRHIRETKRAERESNRRRYSVEAAGVIRALNEAGVPVSSLEELRRDATASSSSIEQVLLRALSQTEYAPLTRDILATLGAGFGGLASARRLAHMFMRVEPDRDRGDLSLRWAIGDALEKLATDDLANELIAIAQDRRHGRHRGLVVLSLGKMRKTRDRSVVVLESLLGDPNVAGFAAAALGKLKAYEAAPRIAPLLSDERQWVRDEAKRALEKLGASDLATGDARLVARPGVDRT